MNFLQHLASMLEGHHLQGNNQPQSNPQPAGPVGQVQGFQNGRQLQGAPLGNNPQANAGANGLLGNLAQSQVPHYQNSLPLGNFNPYGAANGMQGSYQQVQSNVNGYAQPYGYVPMQGSGYQVQPSWDDPNQIEYNGQLRVR